MMLYTLLKILKIHIILSICMNILFFLDHTHVRNTNTQDTWREPTNQSEWKKQLTCFLLYNRALKYCALKFSPHKLTIVLYIVSNIWDFYYSRKHSHKLSVSLNQKELWYWGNDVL